MRWPKRPIRADRRRGHRREETLRVAAQCNTPRRRARTGCAGVPAGIKRAAAKRRARVPGDWAERFLAPTPLFAATVLSTLSLGGCSAVRTPEAAWRPLETAELPVLGLLRGAWMDDEQSDPPQARLLVYDLAEGLVRIVNGRESADPVLNFVSPTDIQPWGRGYVLADGYPDQDRFLELDRKLRPVRVLWESDVERTTGVSGDGRR